MTQRLAVFAAVIAGFQLAAPLAGPVPPQHQNTIIDLWTAGKTSFRVYAPRPYTKETGEKLAANPLCDYVFLNLEGGYYPAAANRTED